MRQTSSAKRNGTARGAELSRQRAALLEARDDSGLRSITRSFETATSLTTVLHETLNLAGPEKITRPYEQNPWVHACISALASSVVMVKAQIWSANPEEDEGAQLVGKDDPLSKLLLRKPNQHQTPNQFREAGVVHMRLDGEDIWFLMDENGDPIGKAGESMIATPTMIVPFRGASVEVRGNDNGFPSEYKWPGGAEKWFPASSVVHFRAYDPSNPTRGLGKAEVAARDIAVDFQAQRYQEGLLRNGGDPGGWMINKKRLSESNQRKAQAELDEEVSNNANRGKWKAVSGDVDVKPNNLSPRDMEYHTLRVWNRETIAAVIGVPLIVIGVYERATFRNFETAVEQFWKGANGVIAYLRSVEDVVNSFFFPRMRDGRASEYHLRYDLDSVEALQDDMVAKLTAAADISEGANGLSFGNTAKLLDIPLDEVDDADTDAVFVPSSSQLMSAMPTEPEQPAAPAADKPDGKMLRDDADEFQARAHLRKYFADFEARVLVPISKPISREAALYIRQYEIAQIKRLRSFAENGKAALGAGVDKDYDFEVKRPIDSFTADDMLRLLLGESEWNKKVSRRMRGPFKSAFHAAADDLAAELAVPSFGAADPVATAFIDKHVLKIQQVNDTSRREITKALLDVFATADAASVASLQEAVQKLLPELTGSVRRVFGNKPARALAIARTESGHASNGARHALMKREGIKRHTWVASGDIFVREKHDIYDGQTRKLGDEFAPGLRRPHDSTAPAGEVVNCRCVTIPEV